MQTAWKVSLGAMIAAFAIGGIAVYTVNSSQSKPPTSEPQKQYEQRAEPSKRHAPPPEIHEQTSAVEGEMPRTGTWEEPSPEPQPKAEAKKPGDVTPEQHQAMLELLKPKPEERLPPPRDPWYNCPNCKRHGRIEELRTYSQNKWWYCPECGAKVLEGPIRKPVVQGR